MSLAYSLKGWLKPVPAQPQVTIATQETVGDVQMQEGWDSEVQGSARPLLAANKTAQDELAGWLKAWVRSKAQRSQDTAISYAAANRDFLSEVEISGLTKEAVESYTRTLQGLALSTQAHHISAVRGFVGFLGQQGLCDRRLLDFLVRPRVPTSAMGSRLCEQEARALLECARQEGLRVEATIHLALTTGLRAGELCSARFCDLRREAGSGGVVLYVVGKGTKSRWVAILPAVFRQLCELHNQEGVNARCRQPLVMNHFGQAYTRFGLGKMVRRLCAEAGLAQVVSPHALRRTHATLALKGGASLQDIQLTLGHARLETTTRYAQYEVGLQRSTALCLPTFWA